MDKDMKIGDSITEGMITDAKVHIPDNDSKKELDNEQLLEYLDILSHLYDEGFPGISGSIDRVMNKLNSSI